MDKCPKCGSVDIDNGKLVAGQGFTYKSDNIGILKSSINIVRADVCLTCGYLETYIADLDKLRQKLIK